MNNQIQDAHTLMDKAVILSVTFATPFSNRRKVSTDNVEADTDKTMLHVAKELLDAPELQEIGKIYSEVRQWIYSIALPSPMDKGGFYFWPIAAVEKGEIKFADFDGRVAQAVDKFIAVYGARKDEARGRLRSLFNPQDYPEADAIRRGYSIARQYLSFGVPDTLKAISAEIWEKETEKAKARLTEAAESIETALLAALQELTERLVERLTQESGKPKVFRDTLVTNLTEFLNNLPLRNLTGNTALEELGAQARAIMAGVDPGTLRQSKTLRERVRGEFQKIEAELSTLVPIRTRKIRFEDSI